MQTLKIEIPIPDGKVFDEFDPKTGKIKFKDKPKSIMERIKTIDDLLEYHDITQDDLDDQFENVPEHFKFQYMAELLVKALNEGWEPDWDDSSQYKYVPWFYMGGSSGFRFDDNDAWGTYSAVGSRLCFKSRELAEYAGQQFTHIYKKFMIINPNQNEQAGTTKNI